MSETAPPATITRYQKRISGPLLDRIGIQVEVPRVAYDELTNNRLDGNVEESARPRANGARETEDAASCVKR